MMSLFYSVWSEKLRSFLSEVPVSKALCQQGLRIPFFGILVTDNQIKPAGRMPNAEKRAAHQVRMGMPKFGVPT
jgi:hypothetical protein